MAGGRGQRLMPLTKRRSKPSIPFGGIYLLIDITLSNCINSQIYKIAVLPQYKGQTLMEHLDAGWNIFSRALGHYLKVLPPQQQLGDMWYRGTADSIRQNIHILNQDDIELVLVLSGDHVYKMDYRLFAGYHREKGAMVTVGVIEVDKKMASRYGIIEVDSDFRVVGFEEKPEHPKTLPGDPDKSLASMGVYLFDISTLKDVLANTDGMDFGKDILPGVFHEVPVFAYPYKMENRIEEIIHVTDEATGKRAARLIDRARDSAYWRDVGDLDSYWNANMDLTGVDPYFNLYGQKWPVRTFQKQYPPAKMVFASEAEDPPRAGKALDSLVSHGCVLSGSVVRNSVLSYNVVVQSWSLVEESVVMEDVVIGRNCRIKKAIIANQTRVPANTHIGMDLSEDRKRFTVTPRGIVVVDRDDFA